MNKGKENYNNIPLPDGLSDAIRTGMERSKIYHKKMDYRFRLSCRRLPVSGRNHADISIYKRDRRR